MDIPSQQSDLKNLLLKFMPQKMFNDISPHLKLVSLPQHCSVEKSKQPIDEVYFPESGVISVVARTPDGTRMEIGLIGCEGMTGTSLLYGVNCTPNDTLIQIPGRVISLSANHLQIFIDSNRAMHYYLLRYAHAFSLQAAYTALCNNRFNINQRLARWLLMIHDRVGREDIMLTHEFLAVMLSVRRASVTVALRNFVAQGAIDINRGTIFIRNRTLLTAEAGDAYGLAEKAYAKLMETEESQSPF
jgi:CRP-like cAMP-binding protein